LQETDTTHAPWPTTIMEGAGEPCPAGGCIEAALAVARVWRHGENSTSIFVLSKNIANVGREGILVFY